MSINLETREIREFLWKWSVDPYVWNIEYMYYILEGKLESRKQAKNEHQA